MQCKNFKHAVKAILFIIATARTVDSLVINTDYSIATPRATSIY